MASEQAEVSESKLNFITCLSRAVKPILTPEDLETKRGLPICGAVSCYGPDKSSRSCGHPRADFSHEYSGILARIPPATEFFSKSPTKFWIVPLWSVGACPQHNSPCQVLGFCKKMAFPGAFPPVFSYLPRFFRGTILQRGTICFSRERFSVVCGQEPRKLSTEH